MLIRSVAVGAIVVFVACVIAVLQGWKEGTGSDHAAGVAFIVLFGIAAIWGLKTLGIWPN